MPHFLDLLRYALVQDWDLDDDGKPETLRLLFGTPRPWLADGKEITVEHAPTAFGEVSFRATSHLEQGAVLVDVALPDIVPKATLLRLRLPDGYHIRSARVEERIGLTLTPSREYRGEEKYPMHVLTLPPRADDSIDLSALHGHIHLVVRVGK